MQTSGQMCGIHYVKRNDYKLTIGLTRDISYFSLCCQLHKFYVYDRIMTRL